MLNQYLIQLMLSKGIGEVALKKIINVVPEREWQTLCESPHLLGKYDNILGTRVYLKTPNAPGQRAFLRCAASFFLEIRQYSCEKMSCATQKSLAAGHIMSFQIHPRGISELTFSVEYDTL